MSQIQLVLTLKSVPHASLVILCTFDSFFLKYILYHVTSFRDIVFQRQKVNITHKSPVSWISS